MKKVNYLIILLTLTSLSLVGQDLSKCKVDLFLLESQESFTKSDEGKEFIILKSKIPTYETSRPTKTLKELQAELNEKLKDNQEYNKDNAEVRDNLKNHYSDLIDQLGFLLLWWEESGTLTKDESKEFEKSIKKKTVKLSTGGAKDCKEFTSTKYITPEEYSLYFSFMQTENSGRELTAKTYGQMRNGYQVYQDFESFDKALERYNQIKTFTPIYLIKSGVKYKLNEKRIHAKNPIFAIQPKDSSKVIINNGANSNVYTFQTGIKPIFSLDEFLNSKIVLNKFQMEQWPTVPALLEFVIDDKSKISVMNFKFKNGQYEPSTDKSIEIFYDKRKFQKINEFFSTLKKSTFTIQADGEEYLNAQITDMSFNPGDYTLNVNFTSQGKAVQKVFKGSLESPFRYDNSYPNKRPKIHFKNTPIFYTDCYNEQIKAFNSLTLNSDAFNDPSLKQTLTKTISASPDWTDFKIERVILTNKSQWVAITNKYTSLIESRYILADVYVKSIKTGKCYLAKEVYFNQKNDPIQGFIYRLFVSVPQELQPYPCNLK